MLTNKINFRRGSTFSYAGVVALPLGVTWAIESAVRDKLGNLVENLTCTIMLLSTPTANGETHSILLEAFPPNTSLWPVETLVCDIEFTDNSAIPRILNSGIFFINVQDRVTKI